MPERDDIRDWPAYTVPEAAGYLKTPAHALRSWTRVLERSIMRRPAPPGPLIEPACRTPLRLSFNNLVECHTLRALVTRHRVSVGSALVAAEAAKEICREERLFLSNPLLAGAGEIFIEKYGKITNVTKSGQLAMKAMLEGLPESIQRDEFNLPRRFYPPYGENNIIIIDPYIAFGKPIIAHRGISTSAIVSRLDSGETVDEIAEDYSLNPVDIKRVVIYEKAAWV